MASKPKSIPYQLSYIAMCSACLAVSSWITIPFAVPFTLQIFAVFLIATLSDWKSSLGSVLLYIALGVCGLPVFSGFTAGPSVFVQITGGYLIGFCISAPIISLVATYWDRKSPILLGVMLFSLILCYTLGTLWYLMIYTDQSILGALTVCVFPFLLPDLIKIALALFVANRLKPHLSRLAL